MTDILELNVAQRILATLNQSGIATVEELTRYCRRQLGDLHGLGLKSLDIIENALTKRGLSLASDPFAPYTCARHGQPRGDASIQSLFLCDNCAADFQADAFRNQAPEYVGPAVRGYCLHCNRGFDSIRLRQWYLCGICDRVVKSIGRSVVADEYVVQWWHEKIQPQFPHLKLELTDPPELRPYNPDRTQGTEAQVDFICKDENVKESLFGIELKTGRGYIRGTSIGNRMGKFQLDHSDCDDIIEVVHRENLPVYLFHAQVIDRASPPTIYYVAVGLWWTDLFAMQHNYIESRTRPRETRTAAYYDTTMFRDMSVFIQHLAENGPRGLKAQVVAQGIPSLYQ